MTKSAFLTRVVRSAEFRLDRALVPRRNDRLDAIYAEDTARQLAQIDRAITRGVAWLLPQADVSMSVLLCAQRTLDRTQDARFDFVHEKAEHYRRTIRDPALRVVLPDYDPDAPEHCDLPDVMKVRPYFPVELLMIDTVWADRRPQPDILDRLQAFEDGGFYGTTHIVVGGLILLENGGAPEAEVREMMQATVETIRHANNITARAEDIFAERCMVLQWLGRHDLIRPAWVMRLVQSQLADGGWQARNMPPTGRSNQHTTIVALAALAEFLAQAKGGGAQS